MWNRGLTFANDCVLQSTFQDLGNPLKSIDIRGNPGYGIYQSSLLSQNYFAGKTGVGLKSALSPNAELHVAGTMLVDGKIVHESWEDGEFDDEKKKVSITRSPVLASAAHNAAHVISATGIVLLDETGSAIIHLPSDMTLDRYTMSINAENDSYRYQLTALGSAMPSLHVLNEVALDHEGRSYFKIAGGYVNKRVSWQVIVHKQG